MDSKYHWLVERMMNLVGMQLFLSCRQGTDALNTFGSSDSTKFGVILAPGKAYVRGFEFEAIANTKLESPYPNSLATIENVNQYNEQRIL